MEMELRKAKNNVCSYYNKAENISYKYYSDLCIVYFNIDEPNKCEFLLNNHADVNIDFGAIPEYIEEVRKLKGNRKHLIVVWVNHLSELKELFSRFGIVEEKKIKAYNKDVNGKISCIRTKDFEFRNFDLLANTIEVKDLKETYSFSGEHPIDLMKQFLEMRNQQGLKNWAQLNFTFSNNELKIFYKDLEDLEDNSNSIPNQEVYEDLQQAAKHGVLANRASIIGYNMPSLICEFDKSSAYTSKFINMKMPMGQFKPLPPTRENIENCIKEEKYFYLLANTNKPILDYFNYEDFKQSSDGGRFFYTILDYDYLALKEWGISFKEYDLRVSKLMVCDTKDYIDKKIREKLVNLYKEKQAYKNIDNAKYNNAKKQLEILYGKALQERNYSYYGFKSKTRYILPQWSLWACAAVRYEIVKAMKDIKFSSLAAVDTDGIKSLYTKEIKDCFTAKNKEIHNQNLAAGFDTDIGYWKFSGLFDNFIQIAKKVYAYSQNGKLTCKFAGCSKEAWKNYFKDKTMEETFKLLESEDFEISANYQPRRGIKIRENHLIVLSQSYKPSRINERTLGV